MRRPFLIGTLLGLLLFIPWPDHPAFAGEGWLKQLQTSLKSGFQKAVLDRYIRYDTSRWVLSLSPALLDLVVDLARRNAGDLLRPWDLKAEGSTLNLSWVLPSGIRLSARIEPQALELARDELAVLIRLPRGLEIGGGGLPMKALSLFGNLLGAAPASIPMAAPATRFSSLTVPGLLKALAGSGTSFRLTCPWQDSSLGRAIAPMMQDLPRETPASATQRFPLHMEDGWLSVGLRDEKTQMFFLRLIVENLGWLLHQN